MGRGHRPGTERTGARVLALAVGLVAVVLIVYVAFVVRLAQDGVQREAERRVATAAALTAQLAGEQSMRLGEALTATSRPLTAVRRPRRATLPDTDRATVRATLRTLVEDVDGVTDAIFTDPAGRLVEAWPSAGRPRPLDLSGREWYRGLRRAGSPYTGLTYRSSAPGRPQVVPTAVVVPGRGIVVAIVRSRTQALATDVGRREDGRVTITDRAGVVVGSSATGTPGAAGLRSRATDPLVRRALAGASGARTRDLAGERVVTGYAAVPGTGSAVVLDVPTAIAFEDVGRLRLLLLLGAAVVAFLLLWLVPLLAARLGRTRQALGVQEAFVADLVPTEPPAGVHELYIASERRLLLGGDVLDAVRTPDGTLALLVADVSGHGPRPAALGATFRAAWRALALSGGAVGRLDVLQAVVEAERADELLYVTAACAEIDGTRLRLALAGHPSPLLVQDGEVLALDARRGPALGLLDDVTWEVLERELAPGWRLVLHTDGLTEARAGTGGGRLGADGLRDVVGRESEDGGLDPERLLGALRGLVGPAPDDDVAVLVAEADVARAHSL